MWDYTGENPLLDARGYEVSGERERPSVQDNPAINKVLTNGGRWYGEGNTEKAIEMLTTVTQKEPNNWGAWMLMANMLLEKGKLEEGRAALEHVPQQALTDPNVFINVGVLFMNQKKMDEAEQSARAGLAQDTSRKFPKLANLLGDILLKRGDREGAAQAFRQYLEMAPNSADASRVRVQLQSLEK